MANRHLSRSIVLQSLFESDFRGASNNDNETLEAFDRNCAEFSAGIGDISFMESLMKGVLSKKDDIDKIIVKAAPDWPLEKISNIDRNILRVGLYELLFADRSEVPPKVAINEAIELAKSFGGDNSSKFVNGVLGSVYKELGEPGKNEKFKKKESNSASSKDLPQEFLGGAVVYAIDNEEIYIALVHDVFGHWTLSKGRIEKGENEKQGTEREIKEELGLDITIEEELGGNQYTAYDPEKGKIKKNVKYFLAQASFKELTLGPSGGLDDAKWFKLKDILELNFYDDIMSLITKAATILASKKI